MEHDCVKSLCEALAWGGEDTKTIHNTPARTLHRLVTWPHTPASRFSPVEPVCVSDALMKTRLKAMWHLTPPDSTRGVYMGSWHLSWEFRAVKCKNVRENISEKGRKALKCMQSNELPAVTGTFSMRWGKTWNEASAIMHLLAACTKSLNKLDLLPSFKYYILNLFWNTPYIIIWFSTLWPIFF